MYKPYDWRFNKDTVKVFDKHIENSVPLYKEFHKNIVDMSVYFAQRDTKIVDIGSSTGVLTYDLFKINQSRNITVIGLDIEKDMIAESSVRYPDINFKNINALDFDYTNSSVITIVLTLQFLSKSDRKLLLQKIYNEMNVGGAIFIVEKVRTSNLEIHDIYNDMYYDFKRNNFNDTDILDKNISLRGIMKPLTLDENLNILKEVGFSEYEIFLKYNNFVGIMAIK